MNSPTKSGGLSIASLFGAIACFVILISKNLGSFGNIVFIVATIGLFLLCFIFITIILDERKQSWTMLLPGSIALGTASLLLIFGLTADHNQASHAATDFAVAVFLMSSAGTVWYNIKRLGIGDGIIITVIQAFIALLVVVTVFGIKAVLSSNGKSSRN